MSERPMLFNGAMVRAILAGRKTQTRRAIRRVPWLPGANPEFSQAAAFCNAGEFRIAGSEEMTSGFRCPHGQPGDRLWVRETWMPGYDHEADHERGPHVSVIYRADNGEAFIPAPSYELADQWDRDFSEDGHDTPPWRPSIHMPRWACRLLLEITAVRVERLQAISPADAMAEGAMEWAGEQDTPIRDLPAEDARIAFAGLWDSTGGDWAANPWVWVIEFKRVTGTEGRSDG